MIRFTAVENADGKIVSFSVEGHSGYSESGSDIVCSAVSSAVWMTVNGIEKQELAKLEYESREAFVNCGISEQRSESADALLKSLVLFVSELEEQYKDFLTVTIK